MIWKLRGGNDSAVQNGNHLNMYISMKDGPYRNRTSTLKGLDKDD